MTMKKLKVATILGTRPELIRLSVIINKCDQFFDHSLIHTGQNYDFELNEIFFKDLKIRKPDHFLEVAGNSLGETLGNVISKSYSLLSKLKPDALLVLGDTNSALSIISSKRLKIPIFHMEAGNRCFDQNVPEEINRKIADHLADINLTYTENSRRYILAEGFRKDFVFTTGSPLNEVLQTYTSSIDKSDILNRLKIDEGKYILASIHREENLDIKDNFKSIINGICKVSDYYNLPVIFSTHPRTRKKIDSSNLKINSIKFIKPLGFSDYVKLQTKAYVTLSDSGTISEESAIMGFPAVSVRTSTERPEAIDYGSIVLGNIDEDSMIQSVQIAINSQKKEKSQIPVEYQATEVSSRIIRVIQSYTPVVKREIWKH
jgi:UDP-N-acetylglucosamine 2-epimerase|tara:strand:- start:1337 stop:2461 length:1125 start_codon:yes stop_codon:yes gene_type:complete